MEKVSWAKVTLQRCGGKSTPAQETYRDKIFRVHNSTIPHIRSVLMAIAKNSYPLQTWPT